MLLVAAACGGSDSSSPVGPDPGTDGGATEDTGTGGVIDAGPADDSGDPTKPGTIPVGGDCTKDADCVSIACDDTKHCVAGRSCTQLNGGRTCGPDGTGDCCETIDVPKPGAAFKLDKYNVTSGRMRQFVTKTNGDMRGYIQAHRPAWWDAAWDAWLPNVMDDGTVVTGTSHLFTPGTGQDGVYQQLGPIHYGAAEAGGNEGCLTNQTGNARTYRLPDDVNTNDFADAQQYPQDVLDQKPIQCATFFVLAAFCAWDGGKPPTLDQLDYAWDKGEPDTHLYPWGMTPAPGGWDKPYPFKPTTFGTVAPAGSDQTYANYKYNFWMPVNIQCVGDAEGRCDYSVYVAPPGRFPKGNGPFGHSDLAGDIYSIAMPPQSTPGQDPTTLAGGLARTGAFDNHAIPNKHPIGGFRTYKATNKYLAVGVRCAR